MPIEKSTEIKKYDLFCLGEKGEPDYTELQWTGLYWKPASTLIARELVMKIARHPDAGMTGTCLMYTAEELNDWPFKKHPAPTDHPLVKELFSEIPKNKELFVQGVREVNRLFRESSPEEQAKIVISLRIGLSSSLRSAISPKEMCESCEGCGV